MISGVLGIDTSCYTTSAAVLDSRGRLIADCRRLLRVKDGHRGLAQSEMVFQHTRNLPEVITEALTLAADIGIDRLAVSICPRPQHDSYMPAFLAGKSVAVAMAAIKAVPLLTISHQENHILAGRWSAGGPTSSAYLAVHVSGGTTEIVAVSADSAGVAIRLLGGSCDLHAGQFIDRSGVAMGLPFPAGPALEALASSALEFAAPVPVSVQGLTASFSGPETAVKRLLAAGTAPNALAAGIERCVGMTVWRLIRAARRLTGLRDVLLVGGVNANTHIRSLLQSKADREGCRLYFPARQFSSDNAVGCAYFALTGQENDNGCINGKRS